MSGNPFKAINFCSKSLEKVLGNDLFLDLLVVFVLGNNDKKLFPKWWSPFFIVMNSMVENTHDLKQTKLVGGFNPFEKY